MSWLTKFQCVLISDILDFWDVHSVFGFQTVSEIRAFEHVPLASKWLATWFFGFVLTLPHLASQNKKRAISYLRYIDKKVSEIRSPMFGFQTLFSIWNPKFLSHLNFLEFGFQTEKSVRNLSGNGTKLNCLVSKHFGFQANVSWKTLV